MFQGQIIETRPTKRWEIGGRLGGTLGGGLGGGLVEGLGEGLEGGIGGGLKRGLQRGLQQGLQRGLQRELQRGLQTGLGRGLAVKVSKGPGQVWFSIQLKFNSFELDSKVGRLVLLLRSKSELELDGVCQAEVQCLTGSLPVNLRC